LQWTISQALTRIYISLLLNLIHFTLKYFWRSIKPSDACMFQNSQAGPGLSIIIPQVTSAPEHFEAITYIGILCQSFAFSPHCCDPTSGANKNCFNFIFFFLGGGAGLNLKQKSNYHLSQYGKMVWSKTMPESFSHKKKRKLKMLCSEV